MVPAATGGRRQPEKIKPKLRNIQPRHKLQLVKKKTLQYSSGPAIMLNALYNAGKIVYRWNIPSSFML